MKINRPKFQDPSSDRNVNEMTIKLEQKLCSYQQQLIQLNSDKQKKLPMLRLLFKRQSGYSD